ncbi:glycosyl transferase [Palleronia sediminis]|uniref:Peptide O-xylosyltransferase n=1 Tax=Palleronia sediminis TaxID=2547833 RepID=A0A4R6AAC3_9RHOB|nr:DUF5928 domain-containing protein [Palleronia sediminis]TDL79822.1 glycosyl transferase [Palleronia sediminis]
MARIAYILLCHKDPDAIVAQARRIAAAGDFVAIHFDGRAAQADYDAIRRALDENPRVTFAARRLRCGWGEWSLVEASLLTVRAAFEAFPRATHFYMISGDCMPIKSARFAHDFLDAEDCDYCECADFFESDWIKTGFKHERLIYRHWFNERTQKRRFYASYALQKRLGITRAVPKGLQIRIGSQWWCLRRSSIATILEFCAARPDILRFFATTWIPDETFFQTLVYHLIPRAEIRSRTLTFLIFSDYGMPASFYNDHYDLLLSQNHLFARKISPGATELKARLGELYVDPDARFRISNEGQRLYTYLTRRGRVGRRFAGRIWETEATLGQEHELFAIVCKKWHVAKRLAYAIGAELEMPVVGYLFDEMDANLPHLGGIDASMQKRHRHRRSFLRMIFEYHGTRRLAICLDPADLDILRDLAQDRTTLHVLEIDCELSDAYLEGHAKRIGLASDATAASVLQTLVPALRGDIAFERDAMRAVAGGRLAILQQDGPGDEQAQALREFLPVPLETAQRLARIPHLFSD